MKTHWSRKNPFSKWWRRKRPFSSKRVYHQRVLLSLWNGMTYYYPLSCNIINNCQLHLKRHGFLYFRDCSTFCWLKETIENPSHPKVLKGYFREHQKLYNYNLSTCHMIPVNYRLFQLIKSCVYIFFILICIQYKNVFYFQIYFFRVV